jgi:RimK family alpha-L-glutamate ligase
MTTVWIAGRSTATNELVAGALRERGVAAELVAPTRVGSRARRGDVVLGRLDVRPALDGVEDGIWELRRVEHSGARVLNAARALLACHDKLQTALRFAALGIPHPATAHVDDGSPPPALRFPVVVKPRFGSWGRDVALCESADELRRRLARLRDRGWFRRQGAIVQELVDAHGHDLRLVVAQGRVVGGIARVAAPGEWRTNVALGGMRARVDPPAAACALAVRAAAAVGGDVVGVDLLPRAGGGWVALEVNGAVDFTAEYSLGGEDVFDAVADAVGRDGSAAAPAAALLR